MFVKQGRIPFGQFLIYTSLALSLILLDAYYPPFQKLKRAFHGLQSTMHYVVDAPFSIYAHVQTYWRDKAALVDSLETFQKKTLLLQAKMIQFQSIQKENERLNRLLGAKIPPQTSIQLAKLLHVQADRFSHQIIINQGRGETFEGQTVTDAYGAFGIVKKVNAHSALVLLLTDPSMGVPVRGLRSGARAIAHGTGDKKRLELREITETTDFKVGDVLVTSGLGGIFHADLPVGIIEAKRTDPYQGLNQWMVKPYARFNDAHEFILVGRPAIDKEPG